MKLFKSKDRLLQFTLNLDSSNKFLLEQGITKTNENTLDALKRFNLVKNQTSKTFYLWGKKGSGKTFWLRSWNIKNLKNSIYVDIKSNYSDIPKKTNYFFYFDNIESADKKTRTCLFEALITQHITKNRFIFASTSNLQNLTNHHFREDFVSRLKQGLVYQLTELPDDEKKKARSKYSGSNVCENLH